MACMKDVLAAWAPRGLETAFLRRHHATESVATGEQFFEQGVRQKARLKEWPEQI